MNVPKHPILAFIFLLNVIGSLFGKPIADRLTGQPEWILVVIGVCVMIACFSEPRKGRGGLSSERDSQGIVKHIVVFRLTSTGLFWIGLILAAMTKERGILYFFGMALALGGVILAILSARLALKMNG